MRRLTRLSIATVAGVLAPLAAMPVHALDGDLLARALDASVDVTVLATFPDAASVAVRTEPLAGFPTAGESYIVASTGRAEDIARPNSEGSWGTDLAGGSGGHGDVVGDLTVIQVSFKVPEYANCLVGLDFRFLSEEFPEYVGSNYNDVFIAELDRSTWRAVGSSVEAPDNFAFDDAGSVISINSAGVTSMSATSAMGTTFDGATPLLRATTPITPGNHSVFLSIADLGDRVFDSAVMIDNLQLGRTRPGECVAGVAPVDDSGSRGREEYVRAGGTLQGMIVCPPGAGFTLELTGNGAVDGIGSRKSNSNPYYMISYSSKSGKTPYAVNVFGKFGGYYIDYELTCTTGDVDRGTIRVDDFTYKLIPGNKAQDPMVLEVIGGTHRNICAGLRLWQRCG